LRGGDSDFEVLSIYIKNS